MSTVLATCDLNPINEPPVEELGTISIRVVVLPKKKKDDRNATKAHDQLDILDRDEGELLPETGSMPMSSYLEMGKGGKQCVVFLVNGQRQETLDNSFIIQDLKFKYLRNRMMIMVDVDGMSPEALGRLMQGSRQGFYRGDIFEAMTKRIIATLKDDPDLDRLEQEAEEEVSELKAADEKVTHTLDQLIDSHHDKGMHFSEGAGAQGVDNSDDNLGIKTTTREGVVLLLPPDKGTAADYPVLVSQPVSSLIRLRPNQEREVSVKSMPSNAWPALAEMQVEPDSDMPELEISQERLTDHLKLKLLFRQSKDFDCDQYPIRAKLRVSARFNGIKEPRLLNLGVFIKPDIPTPDPELFDIPTYLQVSSREPVKIKTGGADTHVHLRWNGKDELASLSPPSWRFHAQVVTESVDQPRMTFSEPSGGRITLLVAPHIDWTAGTTMRFEVTVRSENGKMLETGFDAIVVDPPEPPDPPEPRQVVADLSIGSSRRPSYILKIIGSDDYDKGTCWGGSTWSDDEPGCFQEPNERAPLTLIINQDVSAMREHRRFLTKKFTETEVERRINKYTSHVAFHLYQMFEASQQPGTQDSDSMDERQSAEIRRVASTLIKLMEVSR